jgi:lysophospholipase L1-like esterase
MMRNLVPEIFALPLLPVLIWQGRRTRARTPRMPEASGARNGFQPGAGEPLVLLAVGESPVAGVGVKVQEEAITAQLAASLADATGRTVHWNAYGRNGATVRDAMHELLEKVPAQPVDVLLLAFGVNDAVSFRPVRAWRSDLLALVAALRARCEPKVVLLSGVPPMGEFPALPQPLRWVLGLKAAALDRALRQLAAEGAGLHVPLDLGRPADPSLAAEDGYHPSAKGCQVWSAMLAAAYCRVTGYSASIAAAEEGE